MSEPSDNRKRALTPTEARQAERKGLIWVLTISLTIIVVVFAILYLQFFG